MEWDDQIFHYIHEFKFVYGVNPNICCTNNMTIKRLDIAMTHHLVREGKTGTLQKLGIFTWSEGELEMCVDNGFENDHILLVYDDAPEFDPDDSGEEIESSKIRIYWLPDVGRRW